MGTDRLCVNHRAVARYKPAGFLIGLEGGRGVEEVTVTVEGSGVLARLLLPHFAIDVHLRKGLDELLGLLVGEVVGLVFLLDLYLIVGLHGGELGQSTLVPLIGFEPERRADRKRIILDRDDGYGDVP